ncbi:porin family protein [uncultured Cytophaga sp.]|uniref:porin family protein n=1 Tax=uncultured Cytophaga sp. TaxID=160238 RepID=UPI00262CCA47|nr:porin family protein [uncultured Cytophaga sp.]
MKKIHLLFLISISSSICFGQLNVGLKLNMNVNKFAFKTNSEDEYIKGPLVDFGFFGISGGALANYRLNHRLSIQSELNFNAFRTTFAKMEYYTNWEGDRTAIGNGFNVNMNYLEIPLMGKVSFGNKVTFDITAGAFVGYLLSAKQSTDNGRLNLPADTIYRPWQDPEPKRITYYKQNVRSDYSSFNAGILVGLGLTMKDRVVIELRLNRGLVNINKTRSATMNTVQAQFSVGYYIFKQKRKA